MIPNSLRLIATSPIAPAGIGSAQVFGGAIPDFFTHDSSYASVAFLLSGDGRIECKMGAKSIEYRCRPGYFSITPSWSGHAFRSEGYHETLNLGIDARVLQSVADRELGHRGAFVTLLNVHQDDSPEFIALGSAFATCLRENRPGARLYAESLWNQLVIELLWKRSSLTPKAVRPPERLSDHRMVRVLDYLHASLAENVGLEELAALVDLTPTYFIAAFRKATGKTPHRYLLEIRLAKACELLRKTKKPIAAVALETGFSSQSHLTSTFRREMGTTPGAYREG